MTFGRVWGVCYGMNMEMNWLEVAAGFDVLDVQQLDLIPDLSR